MSGLETGLARTFDPDTSQAAARSVDATTLEEMVLSALRRDGGMTTWELSLQLSISQQSITPRMRPLTVKSFVRESGTYRQNPSGRKAIVWEAVPPEAVQQTLVW
jgi:predicted ArsR family transcriptional regulator